MLSLNVFVNDCVCYCLCVCVRASVNVLMSLMRAFCAFVNVCGALTEPKETRRGCIESLYNC